MFNKLWKKEKLILYGVMFIYFPLLRKTPKIIFYPTALE